MRILISLLAIACLSGCQDAPSTKHKRHKAAVKSAPAINPAQITSDQYSIIVPQAWITEYKRLEKTHWSVPQDSLIWQEGDKFHIPVEVAQHYIELKRRP